MTDPSKEQIQPCPHGHTPGLCRLCMQAEIERLKQQREDWMRRWTDLQLAQESTQSIAASTLVCDLVAQNERLQRQVDELSVHAEKWVMRALKPAHEREMPHCSNCSCPPYDAEALKIQAVNPFDQAKVVFAGKKGDGYLLKAWFDTQEDLDRAFEAVEGAPQTQTSGRGADQTDAAEAMLEAGLQVYGGGWIDHGPDCTEDGCRCGLESWIRRYHTLLKLDISHWPAQPPEITQADNAPDVA